VLNYGAKNDAISLFFRECHPTKITISSFFEETHPHSKQSISLFFGETHPHPSPPLEGEGISLTN
jgi:hypothetical protein